MLLEATFLETLTAIDWLRVAINLLLVAVCIVLGIYLPARVFVAYTNQPAMRWVWYGVGTLCLAFVLTVTWGYGLFWDKVGAAASEDKCLRQQLQPRNANPPQPGPPSE